MKWQPIDTAPNDTAVLVRYNGHIFMSASVDKRKTVCYYAYTVKQTTG